MTEIEAMRLACWPSLFICLAAMWFTGYPIARANGTRPILLVLLLASLAMTVGIVFLTFITYNINTINSTGIAEVGVWYLRIKPGLVGLALIWLGWRLRRNH
jgi:hypothetical protein